LTITGLWERLDWISRFERDLADIADLRRALGGACTQMEETLSQQSPEASLVEMVVGRESLFDSLTFHYDK